MTGITYSPLPGRAVCPAYEGIETMRNAKRNAKRNGNAARSAPLMRGLKRLERLHVYEARMLCAARSAPLMRGLKQEEVRILHNN